MEVFELNPNQEIILYLKKIERERSHIDRRRHKIRRETDKLKREDANLANRRNELIEELSALFRR